MAMAIQISKYQSAESSTVSLKFATKCIGGRFYLIQVRRKVASSVYFSYHKIGIVSNQNWLNIMTYDRLVFFLKEN